jgi:hypothetical protein
MNILFWIWLGFGIPLCINELSKAITFNNKLFFRLFLYGPIGWIIILIFASCYIAGCINGCIKYIIKKIYLDKRAK